MPQLSPEAVKSWLLECSGFRLDGGLVDPGFGWRCGGGGLSVPEPGRVGLIGVVEDVLAGGDDGLGVAGVNIGGV